MRAFKWCSVAALLVSSVVQAQEVSLEVEMTPITRDGQSRAALVRSAAPAKIRIGDFVKICFTASSSGYVSVWDIDDSGNFARILPNPKSDPSGQRSGVAVEGGRSTCGGTGGNWGFKVAPPAAPGSIYVHWTRRESEQMRPEDYLSIGKSVRSGVARGEASFYLDYEIVP